MKRIITYMILPAFCISLLAAPAFSYSSDPNKPPPNTTPYENPNNLDDEGDDSGWGRPDLASVEESQDSEWGDYGVIIIIVPMLDYVFLNIKPIVSGYETENLTTDKASDGVIPK